MGKSTFWSVLGVVRALAEMQQRTGISSLIPGGTRPALQNVFLTRYFNPGKEFSLGLRGIESQFGCGAGGEIPINDFLRNRGVEGVELQPLSENDIGFGVVLEVLVPWQQAGVPTTLVHSQTSQQFPAVYMKANSENAGVFFNEMSPGPVILISGENGSGTQVIIMKAPCEMTDIFEIYRYLIDVCQYKGRNLNYESVTFPMVNFQATNNADWLIGLQCGKYVVSQAQGQSTFKMNHFGALAKQADAVAASKSIQQHLIIDKPFLVAVLKEGLPFPLACGYIAPDAWADPGSIT